MDVVIPQVTFCHALDCKKRGLVTQRHNEIRDALGNLVAMEFKNVLRELIIIMPRYASVGGAPEVYGSRRVWGAVCVKTNFFTPPRFLASICKKTPFLSAIFTNIVFFDAILIFILLTKNHVGPQFSERCYAVRHLWDIYKCQCYLVNVRLHWEIFINVSDI